jgi:bifunctional non-homologous end joining protein LigD
MPSDPILQELQVAGVPEPLPERLSPMLVGAGRVSLTHPDWAYEPKLDGYRVIATVGPASVRLRSRGGHDLTDRFPQVVVALSAQTHRPVILDGELVGFADGRPSFGALQRACRIGSRRPAAADSPAEFVYFAFDVLHAHGFDTRSSRYDRRRAWLERLLATSSNVQITHSSADGEALFAATLRLGFEGIVAKRRSSPYVAGTRTAHWQKFKHASWKR